MPAALCPLPPPAETAAVEKRISRFIALRITNGALPLG